MITWVCLVLLVVLALTGGFALLALAGTPAIGSWEQGERDDPPPAYVTCEGRDGRAVRLPIATCPLPCAPSCDE